MNIKKIVLFAVILMIAISSLSVVSAGLFDFLTGGTNETNDTASSSVYDGPFKLIAKNVSVLNSNLAITNQEIESTDYAYFYQDGSYAEAAYLTYRAKDFYIQMDMNNITLSSDSVLESADSSGNMTNYNKSNLVNDITELVNSGNASVEITFYSNSSSSISTYDDSDVDFDISMDNGIFTLSYSNSSYSDYHTGKASTSSSLDKIDHARIKITGLVKGTNATKKVDLDITSADMPASGIT